MVVDCVIRELSHGLLKYGTQVSMCSCVRGANNFAGLVLSVYQSVAKFIPIVWRESWTHLSGQGRITRLWLLYSWQGWFLNIACVASEF